MSISKSSVVLVILAIFALVGEAFLLPNTGTHFVTIQTNHQQQQHHQQQHQQHLHQLQIKINDSTNDDHDTSVKVASASVSASASALASASIQEETTTNSRRGFVSNSLTVLLSSLSVVQVAVGQPVIATAATTSKQGEIDKSNVLKGYQRLNYLLDNWEKETTTCGMGGDKLEVSCDRTPMKVMDYMGFRSTKDPLYQGDKMLRRLYADAPPKRDSEFYDAVEVFAIESEEASGMAFISSWGEANPGGGKDRVDLFIERARKNVINSRKSLKTVIDILELDK